ncbi:restriction endonuclease subunit S [Limosilactobacillus sp. pH52_RY]|uniref:restriction endonuclease subunit S n=1 Tax=Limosilactobacillus balticus TaxID=2759747 RepID=UPI0015FC90A3|nr:restriction endonuclease subunit S [Limosilactobacillus balticus]MBB1109841.1 restriction endonuclease subunit S [Limosilactobacillus balticus]
MDKKPERLVPEVRFKGFTDDWEQRKLGEVAKVIGGGTPNTKIPAYWNGTINWYTPVEIGKKIYINESQRKITLAGLKHSSAKLLPKNSVLFTSRAGIGKMAILGEEATTNQGFQSIIPIAKELDSYFLFSLSNQLKYYGETHGAGSTFTEISGKELAKFKLILPKLNEQKIISKLIMMIDKLISLQQRKLEQLKQLKKAILQVIASNRLLLHTKKVDMIKVRVADIYKITRGNVLSRSEISNVRTSKYPYPVYSSQTKNHGLMGYYKDFLFKNAITWTTDGANAGTVKYRKGRFYSTNVNGVLLSSEGLANQLTAELLNLVAFKYVSHVGNPKLMNNTMGEIIFNIPKSVETQQYFSGCIESVIDLIGKQEKATDKLNKLKKYLLQKLFI